MPGLIGPDEVRRVAEAALDVDADGVEVLFMHEWGGLSRFADSSIHQSTWREDTSVRVRVVSKGRVGVASTNDFSVEGAKRVADNAREMSQIASPDPMFPGLAPKAPLSQRERAFDEATSTTSPEERAERIADLVAQCDPGFHAAGALDTTAAEIALINSEGQFCYSPYTSAMVTTVVSGGDGGAGYSESWAPSYGELDVEAIGKRAAEKARDSQQPRDLDPGHYEVVLEPAAVGTLVAFLAYMGFGGRGLLEGRSCFSGREGQQVGSEAVTIVDDALSPDTIGIPFDFEGTPKQRVEIIENGVFRNAVYDRRSAKQAGIESTGHALPPPNPEGPFPLNVIFEPGQASFEEMIGSVQRGLLVTRFHYSNIVHPKEAVITGMTRDGTWLVEDGQIKYPVKNFRFTQSILDALKETAFVGRDTEMVSEFFFSASRVPGLKV
ncbi:MAG: TldD/PmbA family protein, partial [Actinomycetota bacterium]